MSVLCFVVGAQAWYLSARHVSSATRAIHCSSDGLSCEPERGLMEVGSPSVALGVMASSCYLYFSASPFSLSFRVRKSWRCAALSSLGLRDFLGFLSVEVQDRKLRSLYLHLVRLGLLATSALSASTSAGLFQT